MKRKRKVKKEKEETRGSEREKGRRERERERGKWVFRFSLRSTEIEPSVFVRARRKVYPRIKSYACVLKSWSFVKLHKVENFPTWVISSIKTI